VEGYSLDLNYSTSKEQGILAITNSNPSKKPLNICVTPELMLLVDTFQQNLISSLSRDESLKPSRKQSTQPSIAESQSNKIRHDSAFVVRNRTGYPILAQSQGNKIGDSVTIENNQELFIHFIVDDEFQSQLEVRKDVKVEIVSPEYEIQSIHFDINKVGQK
jgi:hypothetical protein